MSEAEEFFNRSYLTIVCKICIFRLDRTFVDTGMMLQDRENFLWTTVA